MIKSKKFQYFELKSNLRELLFDYNSSNYAHNCNEYFQTFPAANEPTARDGRENHACIVATSYLPLSDIAKLKLLILRQEYPIPLLQMRKYCEKLSPTVADKR